MNFKVPLFLYQLSKQIKFSGNNVSLTTHEFGKILGVSQQSASRYLKMLENEGLIAREISGSGQIVEITEKGEALLREICGDIGNFLNPKTKKEIYGIVKSGLGEGAYYIKVYSEKLQEKLKFKPYLGTLNIKATQGGHIANYSTTSIDSFSRDGRIFGVVTLVQVQISKGNLSESCYAIIPERTHHKNEIELISEKNLRNVLGLRDGDSIKIEVLL